MRERDFIQDDLIVTEYSEDVAPILEQAKAEAKETRETGKFHGRDFHRVAYIPQTVVIEWMNRGINFFNPDESDEKRIKALLNGEFAHLKSMNVRL